MQYQIDNPPTTHPTEDFAPPLENIDQKERDLDLVRENILELRKTIESVSMPKQGDDYSSSAWADTRKFLDYNDRLLFLHILIPEHDSKHTILDEVDRLIDTATTQVKIKTSYAEQIATRLDKFEGIKRLLFGLKEGGVLENQIGVDARKQLLEQLGISDSALEAVNGKSLEYLIRFFTWDQEDKERKQLTEYTNRCKDNQDVIQFLEMYNTTLKSILNSPSFSDQEKNALMFSLISPKRFVPVGDPSVYRGSTWLDSNYFNTNELVAEEMAYYDAHPQLTELKDLLLKTPDNTADPLNNSAEHTY